MIQRSRILAELNKASKGNATLEAADSNIRVPALMPNVINCPMPLQEVYSVAQASSERIQTFFFATTYTYNVNPGTAILINLASGLWDVQWRFSKRPVGAVSDLTSFTQLQLVLNDAIGPSAILAELSNGQGLEESYFDRFSVLLPTPATMSFNRINTIGAGTGLNVAYVSIFGHKRL